MLHYRQNRGNNEEKTSVELKSHLMQNRSNLNLFWRHQHHALIKRARRLCGGCQDRAEDLVSRATLRLVQFIETHDSAPVDIGALFWRVLHNLAIDDHRTARSAAAVYDRSVDLGDEAHMWRLPAATDDVHAELATRQELAAIHHRVEELPEETRLLFTHRFVEECSYREIAGHLQISEPLARKRVQKLRAFIAGEASETDEDLPAPSQKCAPHVFHHEAA